MLFFIMIGESRHFDVCYVGCHYVGHSLAINMALMILRLSDFPFMSMELFPLLLIICSGNRCEIKEGFQTRLRSLLNYTSVKSFPRYVEFLVLYS